MPSSTRRTSESATQATIPVAAPASSPHSGKEDPPRRKVYPATAVIPDPHASSGTTVFGSSKSSRTKQRVPTATAVRGSTTTSMPRSEATAGVILRQRSNVPPPPPSSPASPPHPMKPPSRSASALPDLHNNDRGVESVPPASMLGSFMSSSNVMNSLLLGPHSFVSRPPIPPGPLRKRSEYDFPLYDVPLDDPSVGKPTAPQSLPCGGQEQLFPEATPTSDDESDSGLSYDSYYDDVGYSDPEESPYRRASGRLYDGPGRKREQQHPTPGSLRTREQIIIHFLLELAMLRRDLPIILFGLFFQMVHSAFTNLAYLFHTKLTAAQRVPLADISFEYLPLLKGGWWMASEYIVYVMIAITVSSIVSILVVRWDLPHRKPLYCIQICRRMLMTLVCCQVLRIVSFLITTLPGASRQCLYEVPEGMGRDQMLNGPAPEEGNPSGWLPPKTWHDILFRVDATNGCGDLMFSSHTIFSMTFVCIIWKYFNFKTLKAIMVTLQVTIIPFILASHKHYSVDVFTALYVTPLVFEVLDRKFPDRETSTDLSGFYNLRFYLAPSGSTGDDFAYVVGMWGREFYVHPEDLPTDLQRSMREGGVAHGGSLGAVTTMGGSASVKKAGNENHRGQVLTKRNRCDDVGEAELSPLIV